MKLARALVVLTMLAAIGISPASSVPVPFFASSNVELLASFPHETGAIGGQVRTVNGTPYFFMTGVHGVSAYNISNPAIPVPAGHLPLAHFENEAVNGRNNLLLVDVDPGFLTGNLGGLHLLDVANPALMQFAYLNPTTANKYKGVTVDGRTYNGGHTIACVRANCSWAYDVGSGGGSSRIFIFNLANPAAPSLQRVIVSPVGATHHVEYESDTRAWIMGDEGVAYVDTSNPTAPVTLASYDPSGLDYIHNVSRKGNTLLVTEEDWLTPACVSQGRFATFNISNLGNITTSDVWQPEVEMAPHNQTGVATCSAHWFTERNNIVAIGWYQQGTYFLDVSNPADIKVAGFYAPTNSTSWAAYWVSDDIVYVTDATRGLEVLRLNGTMSAAAVESEMFKVAASRVNAAPVDVVEMLPHPQWGIACSIPVLR
jgi:hypothetical protein